MVAPHANVKYPDTIAVCLDDFNKKISCIYNDRSMYIWDIKDIKKIGKSRSFLYHSACIWGLDVSIPEVHELHKIKMVVHAMNKYNSSHTE